MLVDDHVAAYLLGIKAIIPDFHQTDGLVGDNMEDKYIEGMVAGINQPLLDSPVLFINPVAEVVGHQEPENSRDGEGEELLEEERQFILAVRYLENRYTTTAKIRETQSLA
jgi:hypothetical protein